MQERRRNILIGLFVLGGMVCLAILVLLLGAFPNVVSVRTYKVTVYFTAPVEDLPVETDVLMLGKRIGQVAEVGWRSGQPSEGVEATLRIDSEVRIPSNAAAEFKEATMGFGRPRVQITVPMGTAAPGYLPSNGQGTLFGKTVGPFDQIVPKETGVTLERAASQVGKLAEALTPAARDFHELLKTTPTDQVDTGQAVGNLSSAMQRMDATLRHINDVIGDTQVKGDLIATVANVRAASEQLKGAITDIEHFANAARQTAEGAKDIPADVKQTLADIRGRVDTVARSITTNSDNLNKILVGLNSTVDGINQGEGTLGHLTKDNRLYEALVLTAQRLATTVGDLQALVKSWQSEGVKIESMKLR
jgi:phospholipid/cholesterol/gamma-HCH transport system substrate-binding protein